MPPVRAKLPTYKKVRYFSIALLCVLLVSGFSVDVAWLLGAVYVVLWALLTAIAVWRVEYGFFVQTICRFDDIGSRVCITFDDGPCEQTEKILDKLREQNVKASFFCVGEQVARHPALAMRIAQEGHTLGNHSYFHRATFPINVSRRIRDEIDMTQRAITSAAGTIPRFFRPPFGVTNPLIAAALEPLELVNVGWDVRSMDTLATQRAAVIDRIDRGIMPGSIILLHDHSEGAIEILDEVLRICRTKGLQPVSLDEAFCQG